MPTEDFFIYFIIACFLVVLIWGLRWICQIFCSSRSIMTPSNVPDGRHQRVRRTRIRRSEMVPAPPPPYTWQPGQTQDERVPRISVYTVTVADQVDTPDDSKLPKYEEIFPTSPPPYDNQGFSGDLVNIDADRPTQTTTTLTSQDIVVTIERY